MFKTVREMLEIEFCSRVNSDGPMHPVLGTRCWVWLGARNGAYGVFRGKGAHRWSYYLTVGEMPIDGMVVMHRCDNPICVNPDHLELGTHIENSKDSVEKGRSNNGRSSGHVKKDVLTDIQVLEGRAAVAAGKKMRAAHMSIAPYVPFSAFRDAVSGITWKHLVH